MLTYNTDNIYNQFKLKPDWTAYNYLYRCIKHMVTQTFFSFSYVPITTFVQHFCLPFLSEHTIFKQHLYFVPDIHVWVLYYCELYCFIVKWTHLLFWFYLFTLYVQEVFKDKCVKMSTDKVQSRMDMGIA